MQKANAFRIAGGSAFFAGYIALLAWFRWVDVYHAHFDTAGPIVIVENLARTAFIFYLFCIVTATGTLALRFTVGMPAAADLLEQRVLGFFTGAGLWHIAMLGLGYLNLYTLPVAIALTLPFVALCWPGVALAIQRWRWNAVVGRGVDTRVTLSVILLVFFGFLLLLTKGLYPAGGHDYFTHYFQYYETVIRNHGIWPNEVWYHYYYSKGAGLFFLGMLLTDPLAPQLVTSCFFAAAAAALYLIVRSGTNDKAWLWTAVALFLAAFINTPKWGEFEKQHEVNGAFIIGIAWMWSKALTSDGNDWKPYFAGAALAVVGAVIQSITVSIFLGASFAILMIILAFKREWRGAGRCLGLGIVSGAVLVAIFLLNYVTTGMVDDQSILALWPIVNIEKLREIGTFFSVLLLHSGKTAMEESSQSLVTAFDAFLSPLRLNFLFPFAIMIIALLAAIAMRHRDEFVRGYKSKQLLILLAMIVVVAALAATAGQAQSVSFYRYSSFVIPLIIAGSTLAWEHPALAHFPRISPYLNDKRISVGFVTLVILLIIAAPGRKSNFIQSSPIIRAWHFALGDFSIETAYLRQNPNSYPHGAIYPGARGAYETAGSGAPIWTMNIEAYCMLPDCRIESVFSFAFGPDHPKIVFGTPEESQRALQASNHNFFSDHEPVAGRRLSSTDRTLFSRSHR